MAASDRVPHVGRDRVDVRPGTDAPQTRATTRRERRGLAADARSGCRTSRSPSWPVMSTSRATFPVPSYTGAAQRPDARDDAEAQEQVLDVAREPLADRRVADLVQAVAGVSVAVARVEHREEALEASSRRGRRWRRARTSRRERSAPQAVRFGTARRTGLRPGAASGADRGSPVPRPACVQPHAEGVGRLLHLVEDRRVGAGAEARRPLGEAAVGDQGGEHDDLVVGHGLLVLRSRQPPRDGDARPGRRARRARRQPPIVSSGWFAVASMRRPRRVVRRYTGLHAVAERGGSLASRAAVRSDPSARDVDLLAALDQSRRPRPCRRRAPVIGS